jgi:hypothetical protein
MSADDARRLSNELRIAYRQLSSSDAEEWLTRAVKRFGLVTARRIGNLGSLLRTLSVFTAREIGALIKALREGRAAPHITRRTEVGSKKASQLTQNVLAKANLLMNELRSNPAEVGPDLLVASLAFFVAGGGFDGDGGIPDQDIALLGIDAHRSIFTHSIIAGAVVETALYALVDFVSISYRYLPENHDRRWTIIHERVEKAAAAGSQGTSLGLAYHLGVDGLIQPGAYHDLPFELSMQGHQVILTANAAGEGLDVVNKKPRRS